jgi:hypothetical protein
LQASPIPNTLICLLSILESSRQQQTSCVQFGESVDSPKIPIDVFSEEMVSSVDVFWKFRVLNARLVGQSLQSVVVYDSQGE